MSILENNEKEKIEEKKEVEIEPKLAPLSKSLVCLSLSFQKEQEISPIISVEFLNMLSFTKNPVSFEVVGSFEKINIQIVCSEDDRMRVQSHLQAYFPKIIIKEQDAYEIGFDLDKEVAIADFGLKNEFMRPISISKSFNIDPFTSIIATLDNLQEEDFVIFQVIFQGVTSPWSNSILNSVSDGLGGSFFSDSPEMLSCAVNKVSAPLFSSVIRIGAQGNSNDRSQYLAMELARSITNVSRSEYNSLIPLTNEGYEYKNHISNIYMRASNRLGMLLNSEELSSFVHYPNKTVVSKKLGLHGGKTKAVPLEATNQTYILGLNSHNGIETQVSVNDEARLSHTHIIGVTGVGKSTLIANMIFEDINNGNGCALFDPHGDVVEDVLARIPKSRIDDVIVIDPSDPNFSIGFNLLSATTDVEKIVLSSDLVSAFKRHATAWGDNMTAVLSNAINTFLESNKGGTLVELKRFLLEEKFRKQFLESVDDQSIHYYWHYEYPMVKKGITPLLTRIDTFLRPKIIRYMLAQTDGINFRECIEENKILLIKLSQGLIGEENSYLLGSLFLSKLNQVAQARQSLTKQERNPYYLYLDEFHNFITPSITSILSGARKYGLGLILAHQELTQIDNSKTLNSVISNPYMRICFRLGDNDAKRLDDGFSYFEQSDLQSLGTGEAIMRIGSNKNDFNINTYPLPEIDRDESREIRNYIIKNSQRKYSTSISEIQSILDSLLPNFNSLKESIKKTEKETIITTETKEKIKIEVEVPEIKDNVKVDIVEPKTSDDTIESQKKAYLNQVNEQEKIRKHRSLQEYTRTIALQRDFKATIEEELPNGKRIDVGLVKDNIRIAIEISVSNSVEYEVQNIQKCIDANFTLIYMLSENLKHLKNIEKQAKKNIDKKHLKRIFFFTPKEIPNYLDAITLKEEKQTKRVNGWRVNINYHQDDLDKGNASLVKKIKQAIRSNNK